MNILSDLTTALQKIIISGAILRLIHCCIMIMRNPDEQENYIKRLKNIIIFCIFSMSILEIYAIINYYYG